MTAQDADAEDLIAFLDANIVLEGKSVADLPWGEVAKEGTIRVLIVPKAMEEIDAKKRDGRLGPHARAFNRLIAPSVTEGVPVVLREADPRVLLEMATCSRIPWDSYDELDPDDGDSRIVAEALNVRNVVSDRRVLVSHDIKPLAYARGRDLPVHQASDLWLRPVEPGPKDKEIQRLKQQVAEFRKDEPSFEISIEVSDIEPPTIYRVGPLGSEEAEAVTKAIRLKNGRKKQYSEDRSFGLSDYDSSYDGRWNRYVTETIPNFVAAFGEKCELQFNQRLLKIRVTNSGQIRADHLVITVSTNDGWLNHSVVVVSPTGPRAPVVRGYLDQLGIQPNLRDLIAKRIGRHEFEYTLKPKRAPEMEVTCEDFRSGQEFCFEGVVVPTSDPEPIEITVSLTAANLRGDVVETFRLEKQIVDVAPSELVDFGTFKIVRDYPVKKELHRLVGLKRESEIEWDGNTSDD